LGSSPSNALQNKILLRKGTFYDTEIIGTCFAWKSAYGYPKSLIQPLGLIIIMCVVVLYAYPIYSIYAIYFLATLVGGKIYTFSFNYDSLGHRLPLMMVIFCLSSIALKDEKKTSSLSDPWFQTYLLTMILPLTVGIMGGPVLKFLGTMETKYPKLFGIHN
jgi:hypothetical protein